MDSSNQCQVFSALEPMSGLLPRFERTNVRSSFLPAEPKCNFSSIQMEPMSGLSSILPGQRLGPLRNNFARNTLPKGNVFAPNRIRVRSNLRTPDSERASMKFLLRVVEGFGVLLGVPWSCVNNSLVFGGAQKCSDYWLAGLGRGNNGGFFDFLAQNYEIGHPYAQGYCKSLKTE